MTGEDEIFDVVDESGRKVGRATRRQCHGDPGLIHPVVHVLVYDRAGLLLLQKRSMAKDVQPGKWDTSVGGHMMPGEEPDAAALREMGEEIGARPDRIEFAYSYLWRSPAETEFVRTYVAACDGPFRFQPEEIDEGRFWTAAEIEAALGKGVFTPHFEVEFARIMDWKVGRSGRPGP